MSHANGQVRFPDGLVLFFEYNGTSDVEIPNLYNTSQELSNNWRDHPKVKCVCGQESEPVEIATDYADGSQWKGKACRKCMCITSGMFTNVDDYNAEPHLTEQEGLPDWCV